jgi:hypothetical protein
MLRLQHAAGSARVHLMNHLCHPGERCWQLAMPLSHAAQNIFYMGATAACLQSQTNNYTRPTCGLLP